MRRLFRSAGVTLATALFCTVVFAKEPGPRAKKAADDASVSDESDAAKDPRKTRVPRGALLFPWDTKRPRWFLSARADVGFLFLRPRASFGYGIPHQSWAGLDVVPIVSGTQGGGYAGGRVRLPRFEIRSGILLSGAFYRGYLEPKAKYDARELETRADDVAVFWASDSEMTLSAALGPVFFQSETQTLFVFGVPEDKYVFAETFGVVVAPPWAVRERLLFSVAVPKVPGLFVGPALEAVFVPEREQSWVLRAGLVARFRLYQDLEVRTEVVPTFYSPDVFGRIGSNWLTITARFFWATN